MRDSGVKEVAIALRPGSATAKKAEAAGFKVLSNKEAAEWADVIMVAAPDEHQAKIYADDIGPDMKPGAALDFENGLRSKARRVGKECVSKGRSRGVPDP